MPTLAIHFSRPASHVVARYCNLIRLGKSGYRAIQQACQDVATRLAGQIADLGPFQLTFLQHARILVKLSGAGLRDPVHLLRAGHSF